MTPDPEPTTADLLQTLIRTVRQAEREVIRELRRLMRQQRQLDGVSPSDDERDPDEDPPA